MIGLKAMLLLLLCQVIQQVTGARIEDPPSKTECPMIKCPAECYRGDDKNGCTMCDCDNTCWATQCPEGQKCVMADVACFTTPCYPEPECVPNDVACGPVCDQHCPYGHVKDANGCDTCPCNSAPTDEAPTV